MKRILFAIAIFFGVVPAFAFAQSAIPLGPTPAQLLTSVAAIEARETSIQNSAPLACVALFSQTTVGVGQQVILAWGSAGAVPQTKDIANMWPLDGASTLTISQAGVWTYPFKFYDANGNSVSCSAKITVTQ